MRAFDIHKSIAKGIHYIRNVDYRKCFFILQIKQRLLKSAGSCMEDCSSLLLTSNESHIEFIISFVSLRMIDTNKTIYLIE